MVRIQKTNGSNLMKHLLILQVRFMIHQKNIKWLLFAHQVKLETHLKVRLIVHYLLTN